MKFYKPSRSFFLFKNAFFCFAIFLNCLVSLSEQSIAQEEAPTGVQTEAKQAILLDFETGNILFEKNAEERMPTSSMSKVMTMYVVFEALKKKQISLDDTFNVSEKAWKMQGSKMWVPVHENVKVEDLIRGIIIQSGNDACIVMAEGLAGTEEAFADAMNKKAKELGMEKSHFMNSSGWPDPNHYSTAKDLALLASALIKDYPDYYKYYSEKEFTYHNIKQGNRNPLLYRNIGADGMKTGHTDEGGYGLIGSGVQDGRRVIMVLNGLKNMQERADESAKLLQWGLAGFKNLRLFEAGSIIDTVKVAMGSKSEIGLNAAKPIVATVPKLYAQDVKIEVSYKTPLIAPLKKGQEVGVIRVTIPQASEIVVPLVVSEDVTELGFPSKQIEKAKLLLWGSG